MGSLAWTWLTWPSPKPGRCEQIVKCNNDHIVRVIKQPLDNIAFPGFLAEL